MHTAPCPDLSLLRRYDRPGPRYTSYPTAPQFTDAFGEAQLRQAAQASSDEPAPRRLSLYVHVPFCANPCFYCGCNRVITRDAARGEAYLARLRREIAMVAELFDRDRETIQLHFGGGTPNFLSPAQLAATVDALDRQFRLSRSEHRDVSIELDPRSVAPHDIGALAAAGFNRASLGVQDIDPHVQAAINRVQPLAQTLAIIDACRGHGFRSINLDLIYGLPRQTPDGFARTLEAAVQARPDRLAVYSYAHMPALFRAQKQIREDELPDAETKLGLLRMAVDTLTAAGYVYIGMDHFALPGDELALAQARGDLHRNFMGYTTHADTDLVGLGVSAISHIGDTFSQNPRDLPAWQAAIDAGRLPVFRGMRLDADDRLRADLIQQLMCRGEIEADGLERRHGIDFGGYFADALERLRPLADDGLVRIERGRIQATGQGRLLLRNVAMCFDRYLHRPADTETSRFSRAI